MVVRRIHQHVIIIRVYVYITARAQATWLSYIKFYSRIRGI